jgi:RHS repeat-associated protein
MLRMTRIAGLVLLLLGTTPVWCQTLDYTQIGIPQNSILNPIPLGFINPLSRQVHLEIPIAEMTTRSGVPIEALFSYDPTYYGNPGTGNTLNRIYGPGLAFQFRSTTDASMSSDRVANSCPSGYTGVKNTYRYFRVVDLSGVHHIKGWADPNYPALIIENCTSLVNPNNTTVTSPQTISLPSEDGKYYFLLKRGYNDGSDGDLVWADNGAAVVHLPVGSAPPPPYDTNGNYLFKLYQPLGEFTTVPVTTANGAATCGSTPHEYIYVKASDGSTQTYYTKCTTFVGPNNTTVDLMTSLVLPDGTQYVFTYDPAQAFVLSGVTLPTGGQLAFSYQGGSAANGAYPGLVSATYEGGMWTFTRGSAVVNGVTVLSSTVMSPPRFDTAANANISDKTVYTAAPYSGGESHQFVGQALYYSGPNTLLKTVNAQYTSSSSDSPPYNCLKTLSTTLNDTSQTTTTKYTYGASCSLPSLKQEFDYGATTPTRTTVISYLGDTTSIKYNSQFHIYNRPKSVIIYAGAATSGTPLKSTTYSYDEYSAGYCKTFSGNPVPMLADIVGAVNHDDSGHGATFVARGNATSVSRLVSGTNSVTSHTCYDTLGNMTQEVDDAGNPTNFDYAESWADGTCEASGTVTREQPTTVTDALGHRRKTTLYSCTRLPQAVAEENDLTASPARSGITYSYDFAGRPLCIGYPDGGQKCNSYFMSATPAYSLQTAIIKTGLSESTKSVFNAWGHIAQTQLTTDPEGVDYTDTGYDALGHEVSISNPYRSTADGTYGITTSYYDALGRVTEVLKADGSKVLASYTGNCKTVTDESGRARKSCFDAYGNLTDVWEAPNVTGYNFASHYQYDPLGNLVCGVQKATDTTAFTSCSASPATWRPRLFFYDALSRLTSVTNPESGTIAYTYDNDGNLATKTAPAPNQTGTASVVATYAYDSLNRLTQKSYNDGKTAKSLFAYDGVALSGCPAQAPPGDPDTNPIGQRTSMCDGSGGTNWTHDAMGRILQERRTIGAVTGKNITNIYNLDGSVSSLTSTGYAMLYTYNGAGRPITAKSNNTTPNTIYVAGANYAAFGGLTSTTLGTSPITVTNTYNSRLQPLLISAAASSSIISLCYDFHSAANISSGPCSFAKNGTGDNGNVFQIVNNRNGNRTQNFLYDSLNRISQAYTNGPIWGETFGSTATAPGVQPTSRGIDAWGNLINRSGVTGKGTYEGLNAAPASVKNQLNGYCYDSSGNLLLISPCPQGTFTPTYTYDAEDRLIMTGSIGGISYIYDGDGKRVKKCTAGATAGTCVAGATGTLYFGIGEKTTSELDLAGNALSHYIFLNGQRIARHDVSGDVHFYFSDHLGTHSLVTDSIGTMPPQEESDFYPYGGEIPISGSDSNHYKFIDKERDSESGLDNFGARYNASTIGRFMSPDPGNVGVNRLNPQSWNAYSYTLNNPISLTDPTGLYVCEDSVKCDSTSDQAFARNLADAQTAANSLTGDDQAAAQRAIDAYGAQGVDNGVNVRFDSNVTGGVTEVSGVANGNKSADNPTGQNINVTFNPNSIGGDFGGTLVGHEGSHVADASAWVASGFSSNMNPTNSTTEFNAYHVQFNLGNALLNMKAGPSGSYTGYINVPPNGRVDWKKGDTFKVITPDLQQKIKENVQKLNSPAFTKGTVLQP